MTDDPGAPPALLDAETATDGHVADRPPWLFVVAQGDTRLLTELEALFRHDPRIRVVEDRRQDRALLPRGDSAPRAHRSAG